ncbi:MAG: hypothetical protein BA874_09300 [Desulfuromonadales bacterium C00003068]|nr:MAG: hypothetical protein BA874_09300 [Desulfuromonadales bacterium C00003068]
MAKKKTTTRKTTTRKKSAKRAANNRFRVLLAALFVTGFLVLCLVVLGHLRQTWHSSQRPLPIPIVQAPGIGDVQLELDSMLWRAGISFDLLQFTTESGLLRYEVRAPLPTRKNLKELQRRLNTISDELQVESRQPGGQIAIRYRQDLLFLIDFKPSKVAEPVAVRPRMAIIMDDLGHEMRSAKSLVDIQLPVTFAILPYAAQASSVARLAHKNGYEVMLHIPMEPRGYPAIDPGPKALLQTMEPAQLQNQLRQWLNEMPYAVGGNNHMGSRLTERSDSMTAVLEVLQERGLYFVDSRTSSASVAVTEARRIGVPATLRDVFLDNVREVPAIAREIRKLAGMARRRGSAVGICHPYPETLAALRQESKVLRDQGIDVVPVSQLLTLGKGKTVLRGPSFWAN